MKVWLATKPAGKFHFCVGNDGNCLFVDATTSDVQWGDRCSTKTIRADSIEVQVTPCIVLC